MSGLAAGIITAIAGKVTSKIIDRFQSPQVSFADVLEAARRDMAQRAGDPAWTQAARFVGKLTGDAKALTEMLMALPITRQDAAQLAGDLQAAIAETDGSPAAVSDAVTGFVNSVRGRFSLSAQDASILENAAFEYARGALS